MRLTTVSFSLVLLLSAASAAADDAATGQTLFKQRCSGCHQTTKANSTLIAPSLKGVFGRNIATLPDFRYSEALKAKGAGKTWTAAELDTYLTSPPKYDPGGKMFMAVIDPTERSHIIAYLKTAK